MLRLYGRIDKATKSRFAEGSSFHEPSTKDTPLHLPFDVAFHGWWRRELPYHLLRVHRKLRTMFGAIGSETAEYLELIMDGLEPTFDIGPKLAHLINRPDPIPVDVDGIWIQTAIWPERLRSSLHLNTWHRSDVVYRLLMRNHAIQSQTMLKLDFVEHSLMPVLQMIAVPRLGAAFRTHMSPPFADLVARMVGDQLLFDCWFMLHGVDHPLAYIGQHLRRYGALPLCFKSQHHTIVLIAKPPES